MARLWSLHELHWGQHSICRELQAPGCDWVPVEVQLGARVLQQVTLCHGQGLQEAVAGTRACAAAVASLNEAHERL